MRRKSDDGNHRRNGMDDKGVKEMIENEKGAKGG